MNRKKPPSLMRHFALQLKQRRVEQGHSLQALADRADVSKSMISKIEREDVEPSLNVASRLAEALGTTLSEMLRHDRRSSVVHIPRSEHAHVRAHDAGHERVILSPVFKQGSVEWLRVLQQPGKSSGRFPAHKPGSEEYVYVLQGRLIAVIDGNSHALREGDSLYFAADQVHEFVNPGPGIADYSVVVKR